MVTQYQKKPVIIEAVQFNGHNQEEIRKFVGGRQSSEDDEISIITLEGIMHASIGDYIIKGVKGEFYPCKPDIFRETYYPVAVGR